MTQPNATRLSSSRRARIARLALVVPILAALLAAASPAAAEQWNVSGHVQYSDGAAAAYATVKFRTPSGSEMALDANANGDFSFSVYDPVPGTAELWAEQGTCTSPIQQCIERDVTGTLTLPGTASQC